MAYSLLHMWFHPLLLHGFLGSEKVVDGNKIENGVHQWELGRWEIKHVFTEI